MLTTSFLFNKLTALQAAHSRLVSVDALFTIFSHTHAHYDRDNIVIVAITTIAVIIIFIIQHTQYGDVQDIFKDGTATAIDNVVSLAKAHNGSFGSNRRRSNFILHIIETSTPTRCMIASFIRACIRVCLIYILHHCY